MATYFLDTSAIVKRYVAAEQGHAWVAALYHAGQAHTLYIAQVAIVEVVAAICRKAREQSITTAHRDQLIARFRADVQSKYDVWRLTSALYSAAGDLCRLHPLRAYDAVQLACVLGLRDRALADQAPAPIFVCADINLIAMATTEGLSVENPDRYP